MCLRRGRRPRSTVGVRRQSRSSTQDGRGAWSIFGSRYQGSRGRCESSTNRPRCSGAPHRWRNDPERAASPSRSQSGCAGRASRASDAVESYRDPRILRILLLCESARSSCRRCPAHGRDLCNARTGAAYGKTSASRLSSRCSIPTTELSFGLRTTIRPAQGRSPATRLPLASLA